VTVLPAVGAAVIFIYGMLASLLGTIVPSLGARLALGTLQLSWLALAQGLGLAVTSVWAGAFMDRKGRKPGIALGLVACLSGLALLWQVWSLGSAIVAMALLGVGGSLVIVGANALVSDISEENQGPALNILNLFVGLGGMATPLVAGNLLHSQPTALALCGMVIVVLALAITLWAPIRPALPQAAKHRAGDVFVQPLLYVLSAITFLYTACEFAMWNWLPRLLIAKGMPGVQALDILSLGFAGGMLLGRLGAAKLLGRIVAVPLLLACALAMAATSYAALALPPSAITGVLVFAAGLAMAPVFPTTIAIVGRLFASRAGTAIGFAITCGFSGLVASSPVIGLLAGPTPAGLAHALLLIPVLAVAIAAILLLFRHRLATTG
jgi:MFS transporter, FHS family, L-fucose permease